MAKFTIQLGEYLQEHMNEGQSISNIDDILAKSKEVLFNGAPTQAIENVIDDDYRDSFILGFTTHFLFDEIGHETLAAWKLALASKILDTGLFVNETFKNLENQIWSNYRVTKTLGTKTDSGTIENSGNDKLGGTITDEHDLVGNTTKDRNATSEDDGTIEDAGNVSYVGAVNNNNERYFTAVDGSGNPVTPKIKSTSEEMDRPEDNIKAYTELVKSGKIHSTNTQDGSVTDTATDTGSVTMTEKDGTGDKAYTQRVPSGTRTNTQTHKGGMIHGYSDHAIDNTQATSTTPQSGVNASDIMGTTVTNGLVGNNVVAPSSVASPNETGKKYLTAATHAWQNDRAHSEYTVPVEAGGDVVTTTESFDSFNDKSETHFNRVQEQDFDNRVHENVREFDNYEQTSVVDYDTDNPTDKQTHHFNRKNVNTTEYENSFKEHHDSETSYTGRRDDRNNTRTLDTLNTVHDNIIENSTDSGSITHVYDRDDDHTNKETRDLTAEEDKDERSFEFSYEMFVKAEPYLKKIWEMYDELFMQLIDDYYFY